MPAETDTDAVPCSKVFMTDRYAVSLPYAADVALLSIFSGSKAQLGSMLTAENKLRNVALDAQGGEAAGTCFASVGLGYINQEVFR